MPPYPQFDVVFNWQPPHSAYDRRPMFDPENPPKDPSDRIFERPFAPFEDESGTVLADSLEGVRQAVIKKRLIPLLKISTGVGVWNCQKLEDGTLGMILVLEGWSVNVVSTGLVPLSFLDMDWNKRGLPWNQRPSASIPTSFEAQKATAAVATYDPFSKVMRDATGKVVSA